MNIICNVTGSERKRLADVLGEVLLMEPIYKKAPTFAYVVSDTRYPISKETLSIIRVAIFKIGAFSIIRA